MPNLTNEILDFFSIDTTNESIESKHNSKSFRPTCLF